MSNLEINGVYATAYQYAAKNQRTKESDSTGFLEKLNDVSKNDAVSFKDMWQSRFPGAYYHVMDASKISQGTWERNDFPFEKFFADEVDESILDWKANGAEPDATSPQVQSRWNSILGQKSIVVPPELEEKMKDNPELAKSVMAKVENFIATHPTRPGRICSYLISLDENGDIAHFKVVGGGGNISRSSSEMVEAYYRRMEQHEKNEQLAEEKSLERREQIQKDNAEYIRRNIQDRTLYDTQRAINAVASYEANLI